MALKILKPTTPGSRGTVLVDRSELWSGKPVKSLLAKKRAAKGHNNLGRITAWKKGGGAKHKYRIIDFKRNKVGMAATVERLEYDPNRSAFIALIKYTDGEQAYIIAPNNLKPGMEIISAEAADIKVGNTMLLKNIPIDTLVHNIELKAGKGGQLARAAGAYGSIVSKDPEQVMIKLRSGEVRIVAPMCRATIGVVSNLDNKNVMIGKAGRSRWLGVRPTVRGVAMNPVDHPLGGGEGKSSGGRHPVTPWGKPTKGKRTRNNKRTDKFIAKSRHRNR
jgi:large subunit ribosomal protein L2